MNFILGRLITQQTNRRKELLPESTEAVCAITSFSQPCFTAGGHYTNFIPTHTALNTLWMNQHNFITKKLKVIFLIVWKQYFIWCIYSIRSVENLLKHANFKVLVSMPDVSSFWILFICSLNFFFKHLHSLVYCLLFYKCSLRFTNLFVTRFLFFFFLWVWYFLKIYIML